MRTGTCVLLLASLLAPSLSSQQKGEKLDPCTLLSATDAASIAGAPMPLVARGKNGCTYGVLGGKAVGGGRALDRSIDFGINKYESVQAEDKAWAKTTQPVHYPANKGDVKALSGIGDDAYLLGHSNSVNFFVYVRKGAFIFTLSVWDKQVASSADATVVVAKNIADQL
jgi:hypothetical protein